MKLGAMTSALARERTPEAMAAEPVMQRAHELGLECVSLGDGPRMRAGVQTATAEEAAAWVHRVKGLIERYGIEVELSFGDRYIENGPNQTTDAFADWIDTVCRPLGVTMIGTVSDLHGGRWLKDPPLPEQLDRLAAALKRLAPVAEDRGVKLAIENHADYRGSELAQVLTEVDSQAVGARFDTGNPYTVIEEPLAAAEALAPFTFSTHIKDQIVESEPGNRGIHPGGLLALANCRLGEGHVDLPAIVDLLAKRSPVGEGLWLVLEVRSETLEESVAYARQAFAAHLNPLETAR